jgi:hypothetical protein
VSAVDRFRGAFHHARLATRVASGSQSVASGSQPVASGFSRTVRLKADTTMAQENQHA